MGEFTNYGGTGTHAPPGLGGKGLFGAPRAVTVAAGPWFPSGQPSTDPGTQIVALDGVALASSLHGNTAALWGSTDGGETWSELDTNTDAVVAVTCALVHASPTPVMLFSIDTISSGEVLRRSTDGGVTFTTIATGLNALSSSIVQFIVNGTTVVALAVASGSIQVIISTDLGATWSAPTSPLGLTWSGPNAGLWDGSQYVALGNSFFGPQIGTSPDAVTWSFTDLSGIGTPSQLLVFDGTFYYLGSTDGFFKSNTPAGFAAASDNPLSFLTGQPQAFSYDGVRLIIADNAMNLGQSTDHGLTWTVETQPMFSTGDTSVAIAYDSVHGKNLAYGINGGSINWRAQ